MVIFTILAGHVNDIPVDKDQAAGLDMIETVFNKIAPLPADEIIDLIFIVGVFKGHIEFIVSDDAADGNAIHCLIVNNLAHTFFSPG